MLALDLFNDVIRISSRLHIFGQIENSNKSILWLFCRRFLLLGNNNNCLFKQLLGCYW